MFDIPQTDKTSFAIKANLPIEEKPWQIGLITGASGSGKTSIAHQLWATSKTQNQHTWTEPSLIDDFPLTSPHKK
nr:MAG: Sigma-54 interaction domain [Bacteriophage sp.]